MSEASLGGPGAGGTGQFDVSADGTRIARRGGNGFTRKLGAGYPDLDAVVERLAAARDASPR